MPQPFTFTTFWQWVLVGASALILIVFLVLCVLVTRRCGKESGICPILSFVCINWTLDYSNERQHRDQYTWWETWERGSPSGARAAQALKRWMQPEQRGLFNSRELRLKWTGLLFLCCVVKVTAVVRERQFMGNSLTSGHICCGGEFCLSEAVIPVKLKRSPTLLYPLLLCSHLRIKLIWMSFNLNIKNRETTLALMLQSSGKKNSSVFVNVLVFNYPSIINRSNFLLVEGKIISNTNTY